MTTQLSQAVDEYNSTYNTSFKVIGTFSLRPDCPEPMLPDCNPYPQKGGTFLFYDQNKNILAIYSYRDVNMGLKVYIKPIKDTSGNWLMKGKGFITQSVYVAFVTGDQDKFYENASLRLFLIEKLHSCSDCHGILVSKIA